MTRRFKNARRLGIVTVMAGTLIGATACGVILYPERKGQVDGRIDPAIAVLDGIGLLFFLVPGVIAFAVDFATGAIYLPGTAGYTTLDMDNAERVNVNAGELDAAAIARIIEKHTGEQVSLAGRALRVRRPDALAWQPLGKLLTDRQRAALNVTTMRASR